MNTPAMSDTSRRYQKYATNELRALVASSEELLESLGEQSGEAVDELRTKLTASIAKAKQRLGDSADAVSSAAQDAGQDAKNYLLRNPWSSLAIGLVAAVAIGAVGVYVTSRTDWKTDWLRRFR